MTFDPGTPNIGVEIDGAVAVVTIARPEKLNCVTPEMSVALERARPGRGVRARAAGLAFATNDAAEGRAAFTEKRPGVFRRS
jgi:1,4-dihydroxy-2-naphthoyl-CoA synthase